MKSEIQVACENSRLGNGNSLIEREGEREKMRGERERDRMWGERERERQDAGRERERERKRE